MKKVGVIDLFCGIGGLTHGFVKEGFNVLAGFDIDETCQFAYEANNSAIFVKKDVSLLTKEELEKYYSDNEIKVLVGCAPCQPFSKYANTRKSDDDKWMLLYKFADVIEKVAPEIVSMENVPQLVQSKKHKHVYDSFEKRLKKLGYHIWSDVVNCPEYGIPQNRKRLVLLASKKGPIELIAPTHKKGDYVTVKDVIGNLPPLESGQQDSNDPIHKSSQVSELNKKRIRSTPPGGGWKDWDENLRCECHKKPGGASYSSVYGRMVWNEPSPTMTTQCTGIGNGRFGHPEQDRAISLREAALLQTFPPDYKFIPDNGIVVNKILARQIGNAVPVDLGRVIAKSIDQHLIKLKLA